MEARRFVVVGPGRCGSNWLLDAVSEHPQIWVGPEVFNLRAGQAEFERRREAGIPVPALSDDAGSFLEEFVYSPRIGKSAAGFKLFYHHPQSDAARTVWPYLAEQGVHVVFLTRRNPLDWHLSVQYAIREDRWRGITDRAAVYRQREIALDPEEAHAAIHDFQRSEKAIFTALASNPQIVLSYEDLVEDFERCSLAVQEFLGVPPRAALKSRLRKQRRWTRRDGILNYQELYEHIASRCEACVAFFEEEEP